MEGSGISVYFVVLGNTIFTFPYLVASFAAFADHEPEKKFYFIILFKKLKTAAPFYFSLLPVTR